MSEALKHEFTWKFPAPAARVFRALTDEAELRVWFAEHAEVEPREGGAFRFWGRHTYGTPTRAEADQVLTRFDAPNAIAFSWRLHEQASDVTLAVEADGEGAIVKGVHAFAQAPAIGRAKELVDDLWRLNWGNLNAHLTGGQGMMRPDFTDQTPAVNLSIFIDAPRAAVFAALIDPAKIQQWFGVPAAVEPRIGGAWHLKMSAESAPMRILDFVENERLTTTWPDWRGDKSVPDQRVAWSLTDEGAGTRLTVVHDGFVRAADISDYPFGWGWFLSRIKTVAQGGALEAVPEEHQC